MQMDFTGYGVVWSKQHKYKNSDVINVSGHRLSTSEIESALIVNPNCSESAVVGIPDELTG